MATHSSILAWRTPWTEEPGRVESIKLQRVGPDLQTKHACKYSLIKKTKNKNQMQVLLGEFSSGPVV